MEPGCLACDLSAGVRPLPGGSVHATDHWVVEHCVGPLGVGTLLVKPRRHCLAVADLTESESRELGPLLQRASDCVRTLARADQVYVCLWSHMGFEPGHIHFVVQPAWASQQGAVSDKPGPFLQVAMFERGDPPDPDAVAAFCDRARAFAGWAA